MSKKSINKVAVKGSLLSFLLVMSLISLNNDNFQNSFAQQSESIDSFTSEGYTGQIVVLPPGIPQVPTSNDPTRASVGSVIGGNWSFTVNEGNLQNFKWNATAFSLDGSVNGTFSINNINNATATGTFTNDESIELVGNNTSFKSTANIMIDNKQAWTDVPIALHLLNGNIVNLSIDNVKTNSSFPLPLMGIVTSIKQ